MRLQPCLAPNRMAVSNTASKVAVAAAAAVGAAAAADDTLSKHGEKNNLTEMIDGKQRC